MKHSFLNLLFAFLISQNLAAQTAVSGVEILDPAKTTALFTDSLKKALRIEYPIRRVYKCIDAKGTSYVVLAESFDSIVGQKDTLHYKIQAHSFFLSSSGNWLKNWTMNDFRNKGKESVTNGLPENSIWFWTKYCEMRDLDGDGLIEPIMVYGTSSGNGLDDGRIKILIYYKNKKYAIRHQNSPMDFGRNTSVDKAYYSLPITILKHITSIMDRMTEKNHAIFPYGWKESMAKGKTYFYEKH